jgi:hypothetical protein
MTQNKIDMKHAALITAFFLIALEALYEGLALAGHGIASGIAEGIYLTGVTVGLFAFITGQLRFEYRPMARILVGYILLRYALFDLIHNQAAGLDLDYIGTTKLFDKALLWIKGMWGMGPIWFTRAIALFWGVAWLLGWENGIKNKLNNLKQF